MLAPNVGNTDPTLQPAPKLGFIYIFRTNYVDVYKLGFTKSSLAGRLKNLSNSLGVTNVEAVAMTIDAREQEAALFEFAWQHADRIKTNLNRKRLKACELFVLDEAGIGAVRAHLLNQIALYPYVGSPGSSPRRLAAIETATKYNRSVSGVEMTVQGMDRLFKKLSGAFHSAE